MKSNTKTYFSGPLHEIKLICFNQGSDSDAQLLAPRITFLDLNIRRKASVRDGCLLLNLLFGLPARELLPVAPILRKERLHIHVSEICSKIRRACPPL